MSEIILGNAIIRFNGKEYFRSSLSYSFPKHKQDVLDEILEKLTPIQMANMILDLMEKIEEAKCAE